MVLLLAVLACAKGKVGPDPADDGGADGGANDGGAGDGGGDGGASDGGGSDGGGDGGTTTPSVEPAVQFRGDRPRNVLMISVDTTRRDQLGLYSGLDTTPNLDAILGEGLILDNHRSCSNWTAPSMLCAINGRWPLADDFWPTGVFEYTGDYSVPSIPSGMPTLASLLRERGYATALVTSNTVFSEWNTARFVTGYQQVETLNWTPAHHVSASGLDLAEGLVAGEQPWFLHLHFIDPHGPYAAPLEWAFELEGLDKAYDFDFDVTDGNDVYSLFAYWPWLGAKNEEIARAYLLAVYRAEIRYFDDQLGKLWRLLDTVGALDDTLVVLYSDHGEQFGEHDQFQHGKSLQPEENRVLAGFWAKNIVPGRWTGPTQHQDLAPSILDALALEPSDQHEGTVVGLAPDDRSIFTFSYLVGYCDPVMAIIKDDVQLIYFWSGKRFMYDLAVDPENTADIWAANDPRAIALWEELEPKVKGVYARWRHLVPTGVD